LHIKLLEDRGYQRGLDGSAELGDLIFEGELEHVGAGQADRWQVERNNRWSELDALGYAVDDQDDELASVLELQIRTR
jgi:hypothetical protein